MSELLIELTLVAADASLPEVAASVVAALRGERDISVGLAYTLYLILDATAHGTLTTFRMAMSEFVIPLTEVTLLVVALRAVRVNRRGDTELNGPGKRSTKR